MPSRLDEPVGVMPAWDPRIAGDRPTSLRASCGVAGSPSIPRLGCRSRLARMAHGGDVGPGYRGLKTSALDGLGSLPEIMTLRVRLLRPARGQGARGDRGRMQFRLRRFQSRPAGRGRHSWPASRVGPASGFLGRPFRDRAAFAQDSSRADTYRLLGLFTNVLRRVRADYVEPVGDQKLIVMR